MPFRFRGSLFGNGGRPPGLLAIGALTILALLISSCYPFPGDVALIRTPTAQPEAQEAAEPTAPEMVTLRATVAVNALRVRKAASAETPIIAGLLKGDVIPAIGRTEDGSWLKVQVPDVETIGWIWAADVTLNGDAADLLVSDREKAVAESADAEKSDEGEMALDDLEPNVTVQTQDVTQGTVTIAEVVAQEKGWIVIYADDADSFGPIIGQTSLEAGITTDLAVEIDVDAATETLYAKLHIDGGVFDVFEFPGPDMPVLEEGEPIGPAFTVTIGAMSMAAEDAGADEEAISDTISSEIALLKEGEVTRHLAIVTARFLRVRSKPETIAEVLVGVVAGEAYPVAGFSDNGEWVAIFVPDIEGLGWVAASVVQLRDVALRVQMGRATVETGQGGRLRLRGGPTLEAPVVGHIQDGESFATLGLSEDGAWALLLGTEVDGPIWASTAFLLLE